MDRLGRYVIERELGSGGMATVYVARDESLGRKVALKVPHPHLWRKPEIRQRFLGEAKAVALLDHENIVSIFDIGEDGERLFLAMEYVEGQDLAAFLEKHAPLPDLLAAEIVRQLLSGLAEAHAAGIVHRDVKPQNLLLNRRGCLKIADFGLSRLTQQLSLTTTGGFLGTPRYASPELADGKPLTAKSDLFSAGLILHECLFGESAFHAEDPQALLRLILDRDIPPLRERRPATLPCLGPLYDGLLSKDPGQRPEARQAAQTLAQCLGDLRLSEGPEIVEAFLRDPKNAGAEQQAQVAAYWETEAKREAQTGNPARARKCRVYAGMAAQSGSAHPGAPGAGEDAAPGARKKSALPLSVMAASLAVLMLLLVAAGRLAGPLKKAAAAPPRTIASVPSHTVPVPAVKPIKGKAVSKRVYPTRPPDAPGVSAEAGTPVAQSIPVVSANAFLRVLTRPPNAHVLLDGSEIGVSPFGQSRLVPAGVHIMVLTRPGCVPLEERVEFKAGDTVELRRELIRLPR